MLGIADTRGLSKVEGRNAPSGDADALCTAPRGCNPLTHDTPPSDTASTREDWEHVRACLSPHISTQRMVNHTPIEVLGVRIFRRDAVVVKGISGGVIPPVMRSRVTGTRGDIVELSKRSLLRMLHELRNCDVDFQSMLCLTYPREFPADGRMVKRHLNAFLMALKRRFEGVSYAWFLEFQQRGAPHLHMFTTLTDVDRQWLAETWFRIVGSQDEKHLRAGTSWDLMRVKDGALRYAAKYAAKRGQKIVPDGFQNVGRFWGCSRDVKARPLGFVRCHENSLLDATGQEGTHFLAPQGGKFWWRSYLWDMAEKFSDTMTLEHRPMGGNSVGFSQLKSLARSGLSCSDRTPAEFALNVSDAIKAGAGGSCGPRKVKAARA
jgi:hypothetical protein